MRRFSLRRFSLLAPPLLVASSALHAQDAKKPPPTESSADLGIVAVSGNTSTSTVSANEKYIRRWGTWELKEDGGVVYGKTAGVESSNLLRLGLRADYDVTEHFATYALTVFDRDRFSGIRSRFAEGGGVAWKILANDADQLSVEAGYQYTQQGNLVGPDHDFSALRLASSWKHAVTKAAYFFQGVEYLPDVQDSKDYRVNTQSDVVAPLSAHVAMKFSYVVRFANEPPLNAAGTAPLQKTDRILSAGIQLTY
jgi:putative salt-induced outer membrane protein